MTTYLLLFFSFLWGNLTVNPSQITISSVNATVNRTISPKTDGINRVQIIKQALVKTWDNFRRRTGWWSELLTITAIMWGAGVLFKIGAWLLGLGSWADYVATLLFIGGGVFFLIWFFQMAQILD